MTANDWTKFRLRINIRTSIPEVYEAWTSQEGLEKWFLRKAAFTKSDLLMRDRNSVIQQGDNYEWMWHGYGDDVAEHGKILEANGTNKLQFTFASQCVVTVTFQLEEGETIVELWQENIPEDENPLTSLYVGCGTGWTFYLANLKSILEGGLDLRNKNEKLTKVINS